MTSKLASLHAGLVARKGEATPAMTNPMHSYVDAPRPVHSAVAGLVRGPEPIVERPAWATAPQRAIPQPTPPAQPQYAQAQPAQPQPVQAQPVQAQPVQAAPVEPKSEPAQMTAAQPMHMRKPEAAPAPARKPAKASAPKVAPEDDDDLQRHRFTFRLSQSQRRRLRLVAAIKDQSLQQLLSTALDNHLEGLCACSLKTCACLAAAEANES